MRHLSLLVLLVIGQLNLSLGAYGQEAETIDRNQLVTAANELGFRLSEHLDANGNSFYSPASIASALIMAYAGSRGETAAEMARVLNLGAMGPTSPELDEKMLELLQALNYSASAEEIARQQRRNPGFESQARLSLVNRFWGQSGHPFSDDYTRRLSESFKSALHLLDFQKDAEAARQTINDRISQDTAGKINDLIPENAVSELTRLVLTNAIYFKNSWAEQFSKRATIEKLFALTAESSIEVPMMRRTDYYMVAELENFRILRLPYTEGRQSMLILLPKERHGLSALESGLSYQSLLAGIAELKQQRVQLELPRFKIEQSFELVEALKAMGIKRAFNPQAADLSGIDGGHGQLFFDRVIHKTYVAVDEEGTEAAAATAMILKARAAARPQEPLPFLCDQPFLFFIMDEASDLILFRGRCNDPR